MHVDYKMHPYFRNIRCVKIYSSELRHSNLYVCIWYLSDIYLPTYYLCFSFWCIFLFLLYYLRESLILGLFLWSFNCSTCLQSLLILLITSRWIFPIPNTHQNVVKTVYAGPGATATADSGIVKTVDLCAGYKQDQGPADNNSKTLKSQSGWLSPALLFSVVVGIW